jgi:hypothetical protein
MSVFGGPLDSTLFSAWLMRDPPVTPDLATLKWVDGALVGADGVPYKKLKELGEGSYGTVALYARSATDRVAVKVLTRPVHAANEEQITSRLAECTTCDKVRGVRPLVPQALTRHIG